MYANSQLVADYDFQTQLGRERAMSGVECTVRELAANIMCVVRGTGRPELIGPQAQALVLAMDTHRSIAGCVPSPLEIAAVLNIVARAERIAQLRIERMAKLDATRNPISCVPPVAESWPKDVRTNAVGSADELMADDYRDG